MPKRISSVNNRLAKNGAKLHEARIHAQGADPKASEAEKALAEERRLLKEEREKRRERGKLPGPTALDKLVRTHHPEGKHKPKPTKEAKEPKHAKAAGKHVTRTEKAATKAAALDAARRAKKKSDKT